MTMVLPSRNFAYFSNTQTSVMSAYSCGAILLFSFFDCSNSAYNVLQCLHISQPDVYF